MSRVPEAWQLVYGRKTLGTLTFRNLDQPFLYCNFRPTVEFAEIAPLYAAELESLNAGLMDRWERDYEKIQALALRLIPVGAAQPIDDFPLHIDGDTAWFRC